MAVLGAVCRPGGRGGQRALSACVRVLPAHAFPSMSARPARCDIDGS